jgi:hypothetical protein
VTITLGVDVAPATELSFNSVPTQLHNVVMTGKEHGRLAYLLPNHKEKHHRLCHNERDNYHQRASETPSAQRTTSIAMGLTDYLLPKLHS